MAKIVIDFNNKIIRSDTIVWIAFPGQGYRLHSDFVNSSVVYPDIFELPNDDKVYDDLKVLARVIARSEKIREWHRPASGMVLKPSLDLNDYAGARWSPSKDNARAILKGYLQRAKKGDLVVTPGPGGFLGRSHVGELIGNSSERVRHRTPLYEGETVLGRRVRWLGTFDHDQIPGELLKRLTSPVGLSQLERSYYRTIYARAYKSFTYDGEFASVISTASAKYTSVPALHIDLISNYAAGVLEALDRGGSERDKFFATDYLEAAFLKQQDSYVSELNISVASPGKIRQFASKLTPLLTNTFLQIGLLPANELKGANLEFKNSANGGDLDDNDLIVKAGAEAAVDLMDLKSLKKLCYSATQAESNANVSNSVSVRQAAE